MDFGFVAFLENPLVVVGLFAVTGLVLARFMMGQVNNAIENERLSYQAQLKDAQHDVQRAQDEINALRQSVRDLQQSKLKSDADLVETRKLMATMRIELEQLQQFREKAQSWLEDKDNTISTQAADIKRLERENRDLAEQNRDLTTANATLMSAFKAAGLGSAKTDDTPEQGAESPDATAVERVERKE